MSIQDELGQLAHELAERAQKQTSHLQRELAKIEEQKRQIEMKLNAAKLAINRLARFAPEFGGHLQCPNCWFESGRTSKVRPVDGAGSMDLFRCETDKHDFLSSATR
jgi:hypothetical protein